MVSIAGGWWGCPLTDVRSSKLWRPIPAKSEGQQGAPHRGHLADLFLRSKADVLAKSIILGQGLTFLSGNDPTELMAALKYNARLQVRVEAILQEEKRSALILSESGNERINSVSERLVAGPFWVPVT